MKTYWGGRRDRDLLRTFAGVPWCLEAYSISLSSVLQPGHAKCSDREALLQVPWGLNSSLHNPLPKAISSSGPVTKLSSLRNHVHVLLHSYWIFITLR